MEGLFTAPDDTLKTSNHHELKPHSTYDQICNGRLRSPANSHPSTGFSAKFSMYSQLRFSKSALASFCYEWPPPNCISGLSALRWDSPFSSVPSYSSSLHSSALQSALSGLSSQPTGNAWIPMCSWASSLPSLASMSSLTGLSAYYHSGLSRTSRYLFARSAW